MNERQAPPSIIGRLLREVSWERATRYRQGGRGFENVLTAEVFAALNILPRTNFLGQVVRTAVGAGEACAQMADEIETAVLSVLPGQIDMGSKPVGVQPDTLITTPGVFCLVEAKRIRQSSFQQKQLAREYLATFHETGARRPLMLLVLATPPPLKIRGQRSRLSIEDAIAIHLKDALLGIDFEFPPVEELMSLIPTVVAYTTWDEIARQATLGLEASEHNASTHASLTRLVGDIRTATQWHS